MNDPEYVNSVPWTVLGPSGEDSAFPPRIKDRDVHQLWLRITRDLTGLSATRERTKTSAALAVREGRIIAAAVDGFPPCVNSCASRQRDPIYWEGMHLNAEAALISHAALHGISLRGSTVYCWPMLNSCHGTSLLIAAGVSVIVEPDYHVPASREHIRQLIPTIAAEAGVLLVRQEFDAIFGAHCESSSDQLFSTPPASTSPPNQS